MRRVAVVIGSISDLKQCHAGIAYLRRKQRDGLVEVICVYVASIHRNTEAVLAFLRTCYNIDVMVLGAGRANHLTGTGGAYLTNTIGNLDTVVVGVAFDGGQDHPRWTEAARLSITEVPDTQVVWHNGDDVQFVGSDGFLAACQWLVETPELPIIKEPKQRPDKMMTLDEAYAAAEAACAT